MQEEGVLFNCNANVGVNVSIHDILREFKAIVLAVGSTVPRNLDIPGRELKGVHFAMDFLAQQNKRVAEEKLEGEQVLATGKNVIVIGGGDTGSDCVGTSNRHGAKSITQFELLPRPPKERTSHMPWPSYPMLEKTTSSHEEGVDRQWAVSTKAFLGDDEGRLRALQVVNLDWKRTPDGKAAQFTEVAGSEREIPCELALLAMGFLHPQHEGLLDELNLEKDERGHVKATERLYQTSIAKIFAAGDMRRGQSLVVWAISEGRECAVKVDEFLNGRSSLPSKDETLQARQLQTL
jgi:glutamate synthase (NADPH/NADH) small chain